MKATPAPKQFIDEHATKQANLKVSQTYKYLNTSDRVLTLLVPGPAGAAENSGGAQAPTARGPEATTAAAERRQTTAGQVSARGCDNDKPDSEMRPEIKHQHHGTDERLNLL